MGQIDGFTKEYDCKLLVWYETYELIIDAIAREKYLKKRFTRDQKLQLIGEFNPNWDDLYPRLSM